jgi:hypothetical protein
MLRALELVLKRAREVVKFLVTAGKPRKDSKPGAVQTNVWVDTGLFNFIKRITLQILCLFLYYLKDLFVYCAIV